MDSSDAELPKLTDETAASSVQPSRREQLESARQEYNAMARVWNSLPGPKLYSERDAFTVKYCTCRGERELVLHQSMKIHKKCGYPLKGEWD